MRRARAMPAEGHPTGAYAPLNVMSLTQMESKTHVCVKRAVFQPIIDLNASNRRVRKKQDKFSVGRPDKFFGRDVVGNHSLHAISLSRLLRRDCFNAGNGIERGSHRRGTLNAEGFYWNLPGGFLIGLLCVAGLIINLRNHVHQADLSVRRRVLSGYNDIAKIPYARVLAFSGRRLSKTAFHHFQHSVGAGLVIGRVVDF